jgi:hypothetical protein|tara:strand:+ start:169 stop:600 length:432 start_codon:yes stop_codon:yes gene_type:complete
MAITKKDLELIVSAVKASLPAPTALALSVHEVALRNYTKSQVTAVGTGLYDAERMIKQAIYLNKQGTPSTDKTTDETEFTRLLLAIKTVREARKERLANQVSMDNHPSIEATQIPAIPAINYVLPKEDIKETVDSQGTIAQAF